MIIIKENGREKNIITLVKVYAILKQIGIEGEFYTIRCDTIRYDVYESQLKKINPMEKISVNRVFKKQLKVTPEQFQTMLVVCV